MANGLFAGIMTPEQAEAARQQRMLEQARAVAQLTPDQQSSLLAIQSGQRTGGLISDFMGFEPPEIKKAREFQSAVNRVQTRLSPAELADPTKVYTEMAKEASALGYVQEAMQFATEAQKLSRQDREFNLRERKVGSEQTTITGVRVFRRGDGPLVVEEGGQDVPYDPKKHGRFETAQDRIAPRGVQVKDIIGPGGMVIGREVIDSNTGESIRKEYFPGFGPNADGKTSKDKSTPVDPASFDPNVSSTTSTETTPTAPVRSGRGRRESNRVSARPPREILRGTNRIKNKAYDEWMEQYGATHNPDGSPK
jgi:hypothetical protein